MDSHPSLFCKFSPSKVGNLCVSFRWSYCVFVGLELLCSCWLGAIVFSLAWCYCVLVGLVLLSSCWLGLLCFRWLGLLSSRWLGALVFSFSWCSCLEIIPNLGFKPSCRAHFPLRLCDEKPFFVLRLPRVGGLTLAICQLRGVFVGG